MLLSHLQPTDFGYFEFKVTFLSTWKILYLHLKLVYLDTRVEFDVRRILAASHLITNELH